MAGPVKGGIVKNFVIIFVGMELLKENSNVMMVFHSKMGMDALFFVRLNQVGCAKEFLRAISKPSADAVEFNLLYDSSTKLIS